MGWVVRVGCTHRPRQTGRAGRRPALVLLLAAATAVAPGWGGRRARAQDVPGETGTALKLKVPELAPERRPRHLGRALLEESAVLGGGMAWYWSNVRLNSRDWDLSWDWPSWKRRLTLDAVRFDQNYFATNTVNHGLAGFAAYQIARGNGLDAGSSYLFTFTSGAIWEFALEFNELPSINDLVVNPSIGFALGESFYQLGEFFRRGSPNVINRSIGEAFSPIAGVNDLVDGRRDTPDEVDGLGFSEAVWHRFQLGFGVGSTRLDRGQARDETRIGVSTDLVMLPGYGAEGTFAAPVHPGTFSSITGELQLADSGLVGGRLRSEISVLGHYWQRLRFDDAHLRGGSLMLGLGSGFDFDDRRWLGLDDYRAVMNVIGPVVEVVGRLDGVRVRWRGQAYGDFAMVDSLALAGVVPAFTGDVYHPKDNGGQWPSVVGARGYYYALGVTAATRLDLEYLGWDAGVSARSDRFASVQGRDRFEEEMVRDVSLADHWTDAGMWLGLRPWGRGGRVTAGVDWRWRESMDESDKLTVERFESRAYFGLALAF